MRSKNLSISSSVIEKGQRLAQWLCLTTLLPSQPEVDRFERRRNLTMALLLAICTFSIFSINMRAIPSGDTYAARYLPLSIWRHQSLTLEPLADTIGQGRRLPTEADKPAEAYWVTIGTEGKLVARYPILTPLLVTPLYAPAAIYLSAKDWPPLEVDEVARLMEKLCASLLAALSVSLLYLALRRRLEPRPAALLSLVYALCTTTWMISSQALWNHGLAQVLIAGCLYLLTGRATRNRIALVGLFCGMIAANRQPDALLALGLGLYALWWGRQYWLHLVAVALIPALLTLTYNLYILGRISGGYSRSPSPENFSESWFEGLAGLLISPSHGLLFFSPFLIFILFKFSTVIRDENTRLLNLCLIFAVTIQISFYALFDWRQGISFGPRWLTDMLPMLIWLLAPVVVSLRLPSRLLFILSCVFALSLQVNGAFWYTGRGDTEIMSHEGPGRMKAAWDIKNAPFVADRLQPSMLEDLMIRIDGEIEGVQLRQSLAAISGPAVQIAGWTLTNGQTPDSITVVLDGVHEISTSQFTPRSAAAADQAKSAWLVTLSAKDIEPGIYPYTVLVRASRNSQLRILSQGKIEIRNDTRLNGNEFTLAQAAKRASNLLSARQENHGFWLTQFTESTQFVTPQIELNTYLNAMILDVAAPVAVTAGIESQLDKARRYLTSQIEADGLVRYHGLPNAPGIGVLGCAITPDTDDTALVWRVAPDSDDSRFQPALDEIKRYRRPDGLYKTWLAPRDRYQCLDPGKDPNPADLTIQMHLYFALAERAPADAQPLCRAMKDSIGDPEVWSYYDLSPTIPIYRLADIRRAGCRINLPSTRLKSTVAGQDVWIQVALLIDQLDRGLHSPALKSDAQNLLRQIASDDFDIMRKNPPLLYHNDLTATVPRYYWSADFGYALWLRLKHEAKL